ncbi:type II toxin-antitoxin system HicB family antitoxin [Plasticicumulans acidivorans]|uniref:Putative RNase H-like HicB family nuclease n=1 Tax=Plasticicumulans acidivorans TaxID=886464 RepID=A0A317N2C2_9GAMM|nr:type II toxin-antitoxin system HicB family antitoxin [Plasticicumulans acidivorans]PWV65988.1 putative RNase H-like HicB family nuclease [Plasticicumulans acidivorans]
MFYPLAIEPGDADHAFGVIVPDIPGCFSAGDTLQEAIKSAHEAIRGHLELLAEDDEDIPEASTVDALVQREDLQGCTWALADIDVTPYLGKAEKINVTLPGRLLRRLDQAVAEGAFRSRSGALAEGAQLLLLTRQQQTGRRDT